MNFTTDNKPRRPQIGERYQLWHNLSLLLKDRRTRKKLTDWIDNFPEKLYFHVYEPQQHGLEPVKLSHEAALLLKRKLRKVNPDMVKAIQERRKKHLKKSN